MDERRREARFDVETGHGTMPDEDNARLARVVKALSGKR